MESGDYSEVVEDSLVGDSSVVAEGCIEVAGDSSAVAGYCNMGAAGSSAVAGAANIVHIAVCVV